MVNISTYSLRIIKETSGRYDLDKKQVGCPKDSFKAFNEVFEMDKRAEEIFSIMTLDTKNKITGMFLVSMGAINSSIVHPREVFKRALLQNASSIIACHNHPSGDPTPSQEDIDITKRLHSAGQVIGIKLLDHIIVGSNNRYISLKDKGLF